MHLLHHIVPGIQQYGPVYGPVYGTWMFSDSNDSIAGCVEEHLTRPILRQP